MLSNLKGWAQEVFLVDSHSADQTMDIPLRHAVHVVQRPFRGFGDQWKFAQRELPITVPWTMKLDPDERLSDELKRNLADAVRLGEADGVTTQCRLWFMRRPLPVRNDIPCAWKTGRCRFSDVLVNEYPLVEGAIAHVAGDIEYHDSPRLGVFAAQAEQVQDCGGAKSLSLRPTICGAAPAGQCAAAARVAEEAVSPRAGALRRVVLLPLAGAKDLARGMAGLCLGAYARVSRTPARLQIPRDVPDRKRDRAAPVWPGSAGLPGAAA